MYMTLKVLPANETFIITDPFRVSEGIASGLEEAGALDPVFPFLSECARGMGRLFGDVVLFVSFGESPPDDDESTFLSTLRGYFPSHN